MVTFQYRAWDVAGQLRQGLLTAADRSAAQQQLRQQKLFVAELTASKQAPSTRRRIQVAERTTLLGELAELLHAGVPLMRSLEILQGQLQGSELQAIVTTIRQRVAEGESLANALREASPDFDRLTISIVQAGEEGGFLEDALRRVSTYLEQAQELRSRTIGALVYPGLLLSVSGLVVLGMLWFLIPRFTPVFARLATKGELPWLTTVVVHMSQTLRSSGSWLLVIGFITVAALSRLPREKWSEIAQFVALRLPLSGPVVRGMAIAQVCRVLGTLLKNGVPLLRSLHISKEVTSLPRLRDALAAASVEVAAGSSLVQPLSSTGQFPRHILEMIAVGEQANQLDRVLTDLADLLERQTQRKLDLIVKLIEPALLVVLAIVVLVLVVALLLPMLQLAGQLS